MTHLQAAALPGDAAATAPRLTGDLRAMPALHIIQVWLVYALQPYFDTGCHTDRVHVHDRVHNHDPLRPCMNQCILVVILAVILQINVAQ